MQGYQKLMLVTHRQQIPIPHYLEFIKRCAAAGITALQLREKNASVEFLLELGGRLQEVLSNFNVPLIINDSFSLAKQLNAAGVHLGQTDDDPLQARTILGPNKIIGLSIEQMAELDQANARADLDYVAASAVFPTTNKSNIKTIWGIEGLQALVKKSCHAVVAIGGINHTNLKAVLRTGVSGVAVVGAIHDATDAVAATAALRKIIDQELCDV